MQPGSARTWHNALWHNISQKLDKIPAQNFYIIRILVSEWLIKSLNKTNKTNVVYFEPHELQMTDHICYLNLDLNLTTLHSRYFNTVTPFGKKLRCFERTRIKNRFNNSVMGAFNPKFQVITLFPNLYIHVILTLIDKQSSSTGLPWNTKQPAQYVVMAYS